MQIILQTSKQQVKFAQISPESTVCIRLNIKKVMTIENVRLRICPIVHDISHSTIVNSHNTLSSKLFNFKKVKGRPGQNQVERVSLKLNSIYHYLI